MQLKILFSITVIALFKNQINGKAGKRITSIFLINNITDYCDERLKCNGQNHTLCFLSLETENNSSVYYEYEMECRIEDILLAHNGIRNRIAGRMNIPNMEHVIWDDELSHMALLWIRDKQAPWILDPCTSFFPKPYEKVPEFHYVNQNFLFLNNTFLPQNFMNSAMRSWYLEKNVMEKEPPLTRISNETVIKRYFYLHNNFTVLAYPQMNRVGCAMARLELGFTFLCNYYRYIAKDKIEFGKPGTNCPNKYPLSDLQFENLCFDNSSSQPCSRRFMIIIILFLLFQ